MRELKITNVLTTDKRFKQMGFAVLPAARALKRRS
jgi:predicted nucleic acid-binding protein